MTHVPIYIKPLKLSTAAGKYLPQGQGPGSKSETGRGSPLWETVVKAQTQGSLGYSPFAVHFGTDKQLQTYANDPFS